MPAAPAAPAAPPAAATPPPPPSIGAAAKGSVPAPSPMEESFAAMDKFTDMDDEQPEAKPAPPPKPTTKPPVKPPAKAPGEKPPKQEETPPVEEDEEGELDEQEQTDKGKGKEKESDPDKTPKGERLKPWPLVEKYKGMYNTAQKEIAELKSRQNGHEVPKEALEKITTLESRNKELEDEIRFTKYEKSQDYQDNYHKPYVEAWQKAVSELQEITITDANGQSRYGNSKDLLMLAQLPLGEARKVANQLFGEAADDMMAHRRIVRDLSDKQNKALEDARKNGGEREKQQSVEQQAKDKAAAESVGKAWSTINADAVAKYEFLRPVEGQTERNERLDKAVKFVDETMELSLNKAKTEQERESILRRHSALRNRAIGFSVLKHENKSLKAELAELKKSLTEFQKSEPTTGEAGHGASGSMVTDPMEAAMHGLAGLAE